MSENKIIIKGKNISLRTLSDTDLANRTKWFNDPQINRFLILSEKLTLEKTRRWFQKAENDPCRKDFIIETKKGLPVGCIGFRQISLSNRSACFYIIIGEKSLWGKGIGNEATMLLFKWAFEKLKLNKIWSNVRADNKISLSLLKKVGFVQEGLLKQEEIINGKKNDIVRLGLLAEEFSSTF